MGGASGKRGGRVAIDHSALIDGFGELMGRAHYQDRPATCGQCGAAFVFTAADQKYVHEVRKLPVKRAQSGAYCSACAAARGRQNRAKRRTDRSHQDFVELERRAERAKSAAAAAPKDGARLLEYVVAKLRVLEQSWSARAAERLVGDLRRARRLAPQLPGLNKWDARLRELIAARGS